MHLPIARLTLVWSIAVVGSGCGGDDDGGSDRADAAGGADATSEPDGGGGPDGGPDAWLTGWGYRRPLVIAAPPYTPPMADQQLHFDLFVNQAKEDGKMRADGGDIRVAGADGTTLLPYWIEEEPTSALVAVETPIRVWFKTPSVVPDAQYVYVYYGNPDATSESSGADTFEFFDDFDGAELDPVWTEATLDQGAVSVSGGQLHLTATAGSTGNAASIVGPELFSGIILGAQLVRVTAPTRSHADILLRTTGSGFYYGNGTWLQTSWGLGAPADGASAGGVISDSAGLNGPTADSVDGSSTLAILYVSGFGTYAAEFTYNHRDLGQLSSQSEGWAVSSALRPGLSANTYGAGFPAFDYRFNWIFAAKRPTVSPLVVAVAPEETP